ncbi:MAG TPA: alpha-amylase family glycosyl hydrolase [bacterium]|nr:alpha-amylase family glycosyl hydrolase [bacterium]
MKKFNFHINKNARERYSFRKGMFSITGNVVFPDYAAAKEFTDRMNRKFIEEGVKRYVKPGEIYAMGLIDEILHYILNTYRKNIDPLFLSKAYGSAVSNVGKEALDSTIDFFASEFPPVPVESGEISAQEFLSGSIDDVPCRLMEFEEMILLKIANENPAFMEFKELFDDSVLIERTEYLSAFSSIEKSFDSQEKITVNGTKFSLIELLRAPFRASPDSLAGQLLYMKENWGLELLKDFSDRLLVSVDIMKEQARPFFGPGGGHGGEVITKESLSAGNWSYDVETENFSVDSSWMPRVVMIAKNVFVWLDQLSKTYASSISTLDKIPDDELKSLAKSGFTGLWLIGLWERSRASKRIKQIMGNHDAVASAYSLYDYSIAQELGGEPAFENLKQRAWRFGIRIASDMVPNHMAIDSKWVYEHPEWFLSLNEPPFPGYTYNGEDLSSNPDIGIYIEDHYFDKSDAAVTFKRVDKKSGEIRHVYHGNDGTCMPWNDTAQLNYLREDVREHVIRTIIRIAKDFPIIRFDAAMTLAKRHYHRLWFPEPGKGGDIASRSERGMTRDDFNSCFPKEFWREVVDRVAAEAPETLLLAEAFWLMEGYFVRTLGMHRVYNSAFMNFMKDEDNAKYRESIRNILEFDPHILERHVNFLNNPDEETAVRQFGTGDKYFGVTLSMVTMPGLPMFGHGQIEGYSEKYGMEYRKAYWNESVNWELVQRHEHDIFPLMHRRNLFAHVEHFNLFDFYRGDGSVDENVFAYSNGYADKRVLVFYHNKYASTEGWIKTSAAYLDKKSGTIARKDLHEALGICIREGKYIKFRDLITGLEYVLSCKGICENGFFIGLNAYKYYVFSDFTEATDSAAEPWGELSAKLQGSGVENLEIELDRIKFRSIHDLFREFVNPETFEKFVEERLSEKKKSPVSKFYKGLTDKYQKFVNELSRFEGVEHLNRDIAGLFVDDLIAVIDLPKYKLKQYDIEADDYLHKNLSGDRYHLYMVLGFVTGARLSMIQREKNDGILSWELFLKYRLNIVFREFFESTGMTDYHAQTVVRHIRAFIYYQNWWRHHDPEVLPGKLMEEVFTDDNMVSILQINEYEGDKWFNKEAFENFMTGLFVISVLEILRNIEKTSERKVEFKKRYKVVKNLIAAAEKSGYLVEKFMLEAIKIKG